MAALDQSAADNLFAQIRSVAEQLGCFDRVTAHEPKNEPGPGWSLTICLGPVKPDLSSGLESLSVDVTWFLRIYTPMTQEPLDGVETGMLTRISALMGGYAAAFTAGGLLRNLDIARMTATPRYVPWDGAEYRSAELVLSGIWNDAWEEVA